jgi:phosphate transport system protein
MARPGCSTVIMQPRFSQELGELKEGLLTMANYAEGAVSLAAKALIERDDQLAARVKAEDAILDQYEMKLDEMSIGLLARKRRTKEDVRLITMTMKISQNLERAGDEATTIARRALELNREVPLRFKSDLRGLAALALRMLKEALDAFVHGDLEQARAVIRRDREVDAIHKDLNQKLSALMAQHPDALGRALHLMVVSKSFERIADHATNIAEEAVYLHEGLDIRHTSKDGAVAPAPQT